MVVGGSGGGNVSVGLVGGVLIGGGNVMVVGMFNVL